MTITLTVLGFAIIVAAITAKAVNVYQINENGEDEVKKFSLKFVIPLVCIGIAVFTLGCSIVVIPTGFTGVRTTFGQINENTVQNGFNWKIPFIQSVEKVNNKQQDITFKGQIWSETSARTAIYYDDVVVTYRINPEKSAWIFANVSNYKASLVAENIVQSSVKAASKTLSDTDATNRGKIEPLVLETLQKSLDTKYGKDVVFVDKVTIGNTDFDDAYNAAIAAKQTAQLEAEKQAIENQKAIDIAKANAEVKKTEAQAKADAELIEAEAEAKANQMINESLNRNILQEQAIEKWDGKMPTYWSGNGSDALFGINFGTD